jgi:hypothetical protein
MEVWPRVLIGVSIFEGMRYCLKEFLQGLGNLSYPNAEFCWWIILSMKDFLMN